MTALTFATLFSLRNANFAKTSAQATKYAQEGIEWVRTGRDRNQLINSLSGSNVTSWNGNSASNCPTSSSAKLDSIWCYQISGTGHCNDPDTGGNCYFKINSAGVLTFHTSFVPTSSNPLPPSPENITSPDSNLVFQRVVLLSDESNYDKQKTATVIVRWIDASGPHESKLTTILRNLSLVI